MSFNAHASINSGTRALNFSQTWGELMHSFFPVIQGNDLFTSFCITLMLIQCITFVNIHSITLNYCPTEVLPLENRLHSRVRLTTKGYFRIQIFLFKISFCTVYL